MAFPKDASVSDTCCEICGVILVDEVVLQEFADGSRARICRECAAGALGGVPAASAGRPGLHRGATESSVASLQDGRAAFAGDFGDRDLTEELLMPVTDLIALQKDVQSALERLASSLERFASEMQVQSSDEAGKLENRLHSLELELEQTRKRLQDTEGLLSAASVPAVTEAPPAAPAPERHEVAPTAAPTAAPLPGSVAAEPPKSVPVPPAPAEEPPQGFTLEAVRLTQRHFNDSAFVEKVRGVRRSLGKPRANLSQVAGHTRQVLVTVAWDIVWYQFLVDLARDVPQDQRVSLFHEGMDLAELTDHFKEPNAIVDEDGRLDASELEVALLSDPSALITEMTPDEERALEDATEEIWDQHTSPEFKWDD